MRAQTLCMDRTTIITMLFLVTISSKLSLVISTVATRCSADEFGKF